MDYIDVVVDYIDVNGRIKDVNYFHFLSTSSREFFSLCKNFRYNFKGKITS